MNDTTETAATLDEADGADATGVVGQPSPVALLLAGLAVDGLDLDRARYAVAVRAARRTRRRRTWMGGTGAVLAVVAVIALWPRTDPAKVVIADASTTTTTTTIATSTTTGPITTVVPTTVATTTLAPTLTTVPTTLPATTTTTLPPNRPMTVSATLATAGGTAVVANTVTLNVTWSDPDLADPSAVVVTADFGDPLVGLPNASAPRAPCESPGTGASGTTPIAFRYASSGATTIKVVVSACGGAGPYGEQQTLAVPVQVQPLPLGRRAVVIGGGDGRSPDTAAVLAGAETVPKRDPELTQVVPNSTTRATVAAIDATYSGPLQLRWGDPPTTSCQVTAPDQSVTAGTAAVRVLLATGLATCPAQKLVAGSPATP
ncbi:MAG: hypothetical protein JST64_08275 [Actinobacteria bacterium]|nr:hypothetical protein [Actinomycetota bacterium]